MLTSSTFSSRHLQKRSLQLASMHGVTLIELIIFIVITAVIVVSLFAVFQQAMSASGQPTIDAKIIDYAQSQLDTVLSRRFDENSPDDGTPCGVTILCAGFGLDASESLSNANRLDDVDDFHGYTDVPEAGFTRTVFVSFRGVDLGIASDQAKRIDVTVNSINGNQVVLSAYKINH